MLDGSGARGGNAASVISAMRTLNGAVLLSLASNNLDAALEASRALSRLLDDPALTRLDLKQDDR